MEVHYEHKSGQSRCADRQMEFFIAQVCDRAIITAMHPRTSILVNVVELHNDGCLASCAVNATVLALIDAGVPMRYMVSSATCCVDAQGTIHVNPDTERMQTSVGSVTLVTESETRQILSLDSKGSLNSSQLPECIALLTNKCTDLFELFRIYISETCTVN